MLQKNEEITEKDNIILAVNQIIDATWILKFSIPDDDVNKTRILCGENPELDIIFHGRNDKYYGQGKYHFNILEKKHSNERIAEKVQISTKKDEVIEQFEVRNKKNIFDYKEEDKNEK